MRKLLYGLLICLIIVTGIAVFTAKDDDGKSDYTPGDTPSKKESHTCYVCGDKGDLKYGSHYYCATHWAMVKTVDEAG